MLKNGVGLCLALLAVSASDGLGDDLGDGNWGGAVIGGRSNNGRSHNRGLGGVDNRVGDIGGWVPGGGEVGRVDD